MRRYFLAAGCVLVPSLYIPLFNSPAHTSRWIFLSVFVPIVFYFLPDRIAPINQSIIKWRSTHIFLSLFVIWSALTMIWAVSFYDSIPRVWGLALFLGIFFIGASLDAKDFRLCLYGLFIALLINLAATVIDIIEPSWIFTNDTYNNRFLTFKGFTSGLQTNPNYLAHLASMIGVGFLLVEGKRHKIMGGVSLLIAALPLAKSAIIAVAVVGLIFVLRRVRKKAIAALVILTLAIGGLGVGSYNVSLVHGRPALYINSLTLVTAFGHGAGSFWAMWPTAAYSIFPSDPEFYRSGRRPRTAHNDILTISIEMGILGVALYLIFLQSVLRKGWNRPSIYPALGMFSVFLVIGLFSFPMFVPAQMFIAALAAGHIVNDSKSVHSGGNLDSRLAIPGRSGDVDRAETI